MAEYEVTADFSRIDFDANGNAEVLQNIAFILTTPEFSCPMNRAFAWSPDVDAPLPIQMTKTASRITEALKIYEPRATVVRVSFKGDAAAGKLTPIVRVKINATI